MLTTCRSLRLQNAQELEYFELRHYLPFRLLTRCKHLRHNTAIKWAGGPLSLFGGRFGSATARLGGRVGIVAKRDMAYS